MFGRHEFTSKELIEIRQIAKREGANLEATTDRTAGQKTIIPRNKPDQPSHSYSILRGIHLWQVSYDGVALPVIGKKRGMFFVAYLVRHAGDPPIHALELEAKSLVFLRRECGISTLIDPKTETEITLDADAIINELNLGRDDADVERGLYTAEKKASNAIQTSQSERDKRDAYQQLEDIRAFRNLRFRGSPNQADKAAKRVRTAIDRLCSHLDAHEGQDKVTAQAAHVFAEFIRKNIREPSSLLWPKGGKSKRGEQAGHFLCSPQKGVIWVVS